MSSSRDDFGIAIRSALLQRGAKQKFSLFFVFCLSVLIFFLDIYPNKFMDVSRSLLNDVVYRISTISSSPLNLGSNIVRNTKKHIFIYKENKLLKSELEKLKSKEYKIEFLTTENKNLRETLDAVSDNVNISIVAKVLIDKKSLFLKSVILNKGANSKIKKGMPVVEGNYFVGRVVEVNYLSSRVLLLNDLNSRISVVIQETGAQAILTGTGSDKPSLEYLPEAYEGKEGNLVFTSGKDGMFSAGLAIGKTVIDNEQLNVKLFSDSSQLSFVSIILNSKIESNNF